MRSMLAAQIELQNNEK